ncbi:DUF4386 domain-containing protein [Nocardia gipuzkoensis]
MRPDLPRQSGTGEGGYRRRDLAEHLRRRIPSRSHRLRRRCVGLGVLFWRARCVPRLLAALLAAAGIGYITSSLVTVLAPAADPAVTSLLLVPALVGELGLTFWLHVKGIDRHPSAQAPSSIPVTQ